MQMHLFSFFDENKFPPGLEELQEKQQIFFSSLLLTLHTHKK